MVLFLKNLAFQFMFLLVLNLGTIYFVFLTLIKVLRGCGLNNKLSGCCFPVNLQNLCKGSFKLKKSSPEDIALFLVHGA